MNNPPAFPSGNDVTLGDWRSHGHTGMTLRDYFAAKAMVAILSNPEYTKEDHELAIQSFNVADAMMKAREA